MEGIDQVPLDLGLDDAVGDAHRQHVAVDLLGRLIEGHGGDDNSFVPPLDCLVYTPLRK